MPPQVTSVPPVPAYAPLQGAREELAPARDAKTTAPATRFAPVQSTPVRRPSQTLGTQEAQPTAPGCASAQDAQAAAYQPDSLLEAVEALIASDEPSRTPPTDRQAFARTHNRGRVDLADMSERHEAARKVGVDVAKRSFLKRLGGAVVVGLAAAGLLIAGAAGAGLPWLLAGVVGSAFAVRASCDAVMARRSLDNAKNAAQGLPPKYDLPMGDDALGTVFYRGLKRLGVSRERCIQGARWLSMGTDMLLAAGGSMGFYGTTVLAMTGISTGLAAISHGLQALQRRHPSIQQALQEAHEGGLLPQIGEQVIETAGELADLHQAMAALPESSEKAALEGKLLARQQKVDALVDKVAAVLQEPLYQVARNQSPPSKVDTLRGAGFVTGGLVLDYGTAYGLAAADVAGVGFASQLCTMGHQTIQLLKAWGDGKQLQQLGAGRDEELARLHARQQELLLREHPDETAAHTLASQPVAYV